LSKKMDQMNGIALYVIWDVIIRLNSMWTFIDFHADFVDIIFFLMFKGIYFKRLFYVSFFKFYYNSYSDNM